MALKFTCKSKDEVPADLSAHYVERNGAWVLDIEGAVEKTKLEEFRTSNIALMKERDDLKRRFEGIDPDQVRKLAEEKRQLEEQQQLKAGEFEKVLEGRVRTVKGELEKQIAGVCAERDALNSRLASIQIDQAVVSEATKKGLRPSAIPDITARARGAFRLVKGAAVAYEPDGKTARVGKDGATPMTLAEWIDQQVSEAPHLFESNAGSGGGGATSQYSNPAGGGGVGGRSVRNPFRKETWNLTEQMKLQKNDPQLAARLKAVA